MLLHRLIAIHHGHDTHNIYNIYIMNVRISASSQAVWKIDVENFPAFIVVDCKGEDFFASLI